MLSDFADCDTKQAEAMIAEFRTTAAARKAAAAEEARKKPPQKKKDPAPAEDGEVAEIGEPFPAADVIAAATNSVHKFSIVEASAFSRDRRRALIIEEINHHGERYHRIKTTSYAYFRTKEQAISAAKAHRMKLTIYENSK